MLSRGNKDVNHPLNRFAHDLIACFVPVIKHSVHIDLPRASNQKEGDKPENVRRPVDADSAYFWNEARGEDADFEQRLSVAAAQNPQPELHICGDKTVRYEHGALAMPAAHCAGVRKIGFITEPVAPGPGP